MRKTTLSQTSSASGACQSTTTAATPSTWTPIPDIVIDKLRHECGLGAADMLVLLYILRRTWGYGKSADAIALSQFMNGITTAGGTILDYGCGIGSKTTLIRSLRHLEEQGLILCHQGHGHGSSVYTVLIPAPNGLALAAGTAARPGAATSEIAVDTDRTVQSRSGSLSGPIRRVRGVQDMDLQERAFVQKETTYDDGDAHGRGKLTDDAGPVAVTDGVSEQSVQDLVGAGIREREAVRLARQCTAEDVSRAIQVVGQLADSGRIDNAPAYLFTMLERGFLQPVAIHSAPPAVAVPTVIPPAEGGRSPVPEVEDIWAAVKAHMSQSMTAENYHQWIAPTTWSARGSSLCITSIDEFNRCWLRHKLDGKVRQALRASGLSEVEVTYEVAPCMTSKAS